MKSTTRANKYRKKQRSKNMNAVQKQNNKVCLMGKIVAEPVFSHELYGEEFYDFTLEVPRLSGQVDLIPVTFSERLMAQDDLTPGSHIGVLGQFRSYNKISGEKSRLMLTVFAREFVDYDDGSEKSNYIEINGYVCKPPVYRTTPFDRKICDILLAVNRGYNKSDYIPCIAWGRNALYVRNAPIGCNLQIFGRVQSRVYGKRLEDGSVEERTAYELSISKLKKIDPLSEIAATHGE